MVDPGVVISFEKPSFPALLSIDHTSPLRVWMEVWWAGFPPCRSPEHGPARQEQLPLHGVITIEK
jgi:hypothetical protein